MSEARALDAPRTLPPEPIATSEPAARLEGLRPPTRVVSNDAALRINPRLTSSLYGRGLAKKRNGSIAEGDLDIANAKAMDPNIVKEFADYGVQ